MQGIRNTKTHRKNEETRKQNAMKKRHEHRLQRRRITKTDCNEKETRKQIAMKKINRGVELVPQEKGSKRNRILVRFVI